MPLDTDNGLLVVNKGITPAVGEIAYVCGRVLTKSGEPRRNGYVENWQTGVNGSCLHSGGRNTGGYDSNFQAFHCPHIHFAISKSGHRLIATQMLIKGHPANERDGIVKSNRAKGEMLGSVMVDLQPVSGSELKEYSAHWDIGNQLIYANAYKSTTT